MQIVIKGKNVKMKRISRVKRSLLAHCLGKYAEMSICACCDYISWLSKFRKLPQDDIRFLATWACVAMGTLTADEEEAFWEEYSKKESAIKNILK